MDDRLTILIACFPTGGGSEHVRGSRPGGDVLSCAMTDDGEPIAEHLSSSEGYARHDMGLTSDWKHEHYCAAAFPYGYDLIWIGTAYKTDERWRAALAKNRARYPEPAAVEA